GMEPSQAPEVVELVSLGRRLGARLGPRATGGLAMRNGLRCIVTAAEPPFAALGLGDFVEVADFDPHTGQIFCLGTRPPDADAPLFSMLFRAKAEIGALAELRLAAGHAVLKDVEAVERDARPLLVATEVLRLLRETDTVALGGSDLLVVAKTLPALTRRLDALLPTPPEALP
ncbi:MAG TPA: hypothetical protein VI997_09940, partial [Candidatus Thermoplasmatota archaeon]|nr:hypothetical protein [Candidatus Thermoplasmatota archaeon]